MLTNLNFNNMALESEVIRINEAKLEGPSKQPSQGECWSKRRGALRRQFDGRESEIWDPAFYREWLEYVRAVETGELTGY